MRSLLFAIACLFSVFSPARAQTPPQVLNHYKAYTAALEAGDREDAIQAAKKAWMASEKLLGDHKTTGDLAFNYAELTSGLQNERAYNDFMSAYNRSIELASFHDKNAISLELERHTRRIVLGLSVSKYRNGRMEMGGRRNYLDSMKKALEDYDRTEGIFAADYEVLNARYYQYKRQYRASVKAGKRAERLYQKLGNPKESPFEYALPIYLAKTYEKDGQSVQALLQYQKAMQTKYDNDIARKHAAEGKSNWLRLFYDLEDKGLRAEMDAAGVCTECEPQIVGEGQPIPVYRVPAITPAKADVSGEVVLIFDLNAEGRVINPRIAASTGKMFDEAVLDIVKSWRYSKSRSDNDSSLRKNLVVKSLFEMRSGKGRLFKSGKLKEKLEIPGGYNAINQDSTLLTTSSRVVVSRHTKF